MGSLDRQLVRDVAANGGGNQPFGCELRRRLSCRPLIDVHKRYARASARQAPGDRKTDTLCRAGNDRHSPFEITLHVKQCSFAH
jgi:hypothetical protein